MIDLGAISRNVNFLKSRIGGAQFWAVVKADAYGHGAERVALHIENLVHGFCVALTEEGTALRVAGITKPILVLTPLAMSDDALAAKYYNLTVTINGPSSARLAAGLDCHIKVNTGMNRYGCNIAELPDVISAARECGANVCGVYSHMYCPHIAKERERQLVAFRVAARAVNRAYPRAICHLSATTGALLGGEYIMDGVRCGIGMYGYAPHGFSREGLAPALKVYARRVQTGAFVPNGAGYSVAAQSYKKLSSYRLGYADGFARCAPLGVGNLCMDAFVSEDEREFIPVFSDADEYAARCNTISYETLCSVTRRSERIYIQ